jgi:hypothetical protein
VRFVVIEDTKFEYEGLAMNNQSKLISLLLTVAFNMPANAGGIKPLYVDTAQKSLGTNVFATDILRYRCGIKTGINSAFVRIRDTLPIAKPVLLVQTAPWTGSTCGVFNTPQKDANATHTSGDNDSAWSPYTQIVPVVSGGYFCAKVTKLAGTQNNAPAPAQANFAESYQLDVVCFNNQKGLGEIISPLFPGIYLQNQ